MIFTLQHPKYMIDSKTMITSNVLYYMSKLDISELIQQSSSSKLFEILAAAKRLKTIITTHDAEMIELSEYICSLITSRLFQILEKQGISLDVHR